jgi:hypothetical protein
VSSILIEQTQLKVSEAYRNQAAQKCFFCRGVWALISPLRNSLAQTRPRGISGLIRHQSICVVTRGCNDDVIVFPLHAAIYDDAHAASARGVSARHGGRAKERVAEGAREGERRVKRKRRLSDREGCGAPLFRSRFPPPPRNFHSCISRCITLRAHLTTSHPPTPCTRCTRGSVEASARARPGLIRYKRGTSTRDETP